MTFKLAVRLLIVATMALAGKTAVAQRQRGPTPAPSPVEPALAMITPQLVNAHFRFLANDLLEHAAPGTKGAEITARYLAAQLEIDGLKPAAASGAYLQAVPLRAVLSEPSIILGAGRQTITLNALDDFLVLTEPPDSTINLDADVVFAGYGVEAPEWGWDDYKGVPQTGKLVLLLANDPGFRDSTIFGGRAPTKYADPAFKLAQAAKMGAVGVLLIHTEESSGVPWPELRKTLSGEILKIDSRAAAGSVRFVAWLREEAVRAALEASGRNYDLLLRRAQQREFSPILAGIHAAIDIRTRVRRLRGTNVIARLDGSGGSGDVVVAARADDAVSTATLLAVAAALSRTPARPRSVLFVSTSGRIGEDYFLSESGSPGDLAAAIAIASRARSDSARPMTATGLRYSSLATTVANAARAEDVALAPDSTADFAFTASDAYPFALRGAPAIEVAPCLSTGCARTLVRLVFDLASSSERPTWVPNAPFRSPRE